LGWLEFDGGGFQQQSGRDSHRYQPYGSAMIDQQPRRLKGGSKAKAGSLGRWENEGGAARPASKRGRGKHILLAETEENILQCLGAAVIMQWNDLPTDVQRKLFAHSVSVGEPSHTPKLKERVARFLHTHKDGG
jgi:hypothetical protein